MTAQLVNGKELALSIREKLAQELAATGHCPHLAVVLIGNDEASMIYDRNKQKAAQKAGMVCDIHHLPEETPEEEVSALIDKLNRDADVHGVMVQLPMPPHLSAAKILERIVPEKDVDGFTPVNAGRLQMKDKRAIVSATPAGILRLLTSVCSDLSGMHAVIIGRSNIVGKPLASLLLNQDCTVTTAHSKTRNLPEIARQADILIAACGCPKIVKKDWVKDGAFVIDVGINRIDGKLCGDVDFEEVVEKAGFITPVPGGVGPMTIAMLLCNTYQAYLEQTGSLKK